MDWVDTVGGVRASCASIQDMSLAESQRRAGQVGGVRACNHVCLSGPVSLLLDMSLGWTLKVGVLADLPLLEAALYVVFLS